MKTIIMNGTIGFALALGVFSAVPLSHVKSAAPPMDARTACPENTIKECHQGCLDLGLGMRCEVSCKHTNGC